MFQFLPYSVNKSCEHAHTGPLKPKITTRLFVHVHTVTVEAKCIDHFLKKKKIFKTDCRSKSSLVKQTVVIQQLWNEAN